MRGPYREMLLSFAMFLFGLAVLVGCIAWAMVMAGIAATYVAIVCLVVGGLGITTAVSRSLARDPQA
jgi:hypothetical protein